MASATHGPRPPGAPPGAPPPPPSQAWPQWTAPPAPPHGMPWPGQPAPPYRPLSSKRRAIAILAVPVGLAPILFLAAHAALLTLAFQDIGFPPEAQAEGLPPGFASRLMASVIAVMVLGIAMGGTMLAQALVVGFWARDAANNVRALGAQGLSWSPGWGIGGWFIPYANLAIPFIMLREVWRATEAPFLPPGAWRDLPVPAWTGWWWGLWVALSMGPALLMIPVEMLVIMRGLPLWVMAFPLAACLALAAAAYVLFLRFVDALTLRQEAAARRLGMAPVP